MNTYVDLARRGAQDCGDEALYTYLVNGETEVAQLTWAELDLRARAIAAQMQDLGLAGQRVLLIYPPGLDYVVAFYACLYAGVIAVPAYPPTLNRSVSQLTNIIGDASIEVALTNRQIIAGRDVIIAIEPALGRLSWLVTDETPDDRAADWRPPRLTPDSIAFLQYTSGSTSAPKGAVLTHGNLVHCGNATAARLVAPGVRLLSWLPQYHDYGLFFGILQPVFGRNPITLMSPIDFLSRPARWVQAISRFRASASAAPNFAYDLCARKTTAEQRAELDLSCWKVAGNAAEPVRPDTLARFAATFADAGFRASAALSLYGLAEGLCVSSGQTGVPPRITAFDPLVLGHGRAVERGESDGGIPIVSAGTALDGQEVVIVEPGSGTQCAPGTVGEIWVAGTSVGHGYWNRPVETAESFGARLAGADAAYLRTGDLGFLHGGELYVAGRRKDVIIVRGRNVYPQDLEYTAESSHPALRPGCAAAVDLRDPASPDDEGERIAFVHEVRPNWNGDLAEAAAALHRAIATEHGLAICAVTLIPAGQIPKTSSGKIRRAETRSMLRAGEFDVLFESRTPVLDPAAHRRRHDPPRPDGVVTAEQIEAWLVDLVASRSGMDPENVDSAAPFAALGLRSVDAVDMMARLGEWIGAPVPALLAWDHPTIGALARHLATNVAADDRESAA